MATNFPTSVDNFTNPTANDSLNLPSHSTQHANANDAIEAIEGYLLTEPFGLRLVKAQTIGTTVASVSVTNAFDATFDDYLIVLSGGIASGATVLNVIMTGTTTGYYGCYINGAYSTTTVSNANDNNAARWLYGGYGSVNSLNAKFDLSQPFLTKNTFIRGQYASNGGGAGSYTGILDNSTSYTGLTITCNTGGITMTGGTVYVYGYVKA